MARAFAALVVFASVYLLLGSVQHAEASKIKSLITKHDKQVVHGDQVENEDDKGSAFQTVEP